MNLRKYPALAIWTAALAVPHFPLQAGDLSMAVRTEDAAAFGKAIKTGAPIDELDPSGRTPLFHAVVTRKPAVVKSLLDAGAKVSVEGQSREPLWAAVVNGDREIISMLLNSGADPAAGIPGWRPVDAAVLSGRVPVLEALMAAKPDLQLPATIPVIEKGDDANVGILGMSSGAAGTINDALMAGHPDMAGFLIRKGVSRGESKKMNHLIFLASGFQPSAPPGLIDALLKAGANPSAYVIPPYHVEELRSRCGTEVAARLGRADLVKRYLTGMRAPQGFFDRLLTIAMLSGDAATINEVKSHSPEAKPFPLERLEKTDGYLAGPESDPRSSWDTRESGALLLKPRANEPPAALTSTDAIRVAVIAGKESDNEAALLAAELSTVDGWTVVERDAMETLLAERDFDFAKPRGLVEIGDKLNAGFLIMLGKPGEGADRVLRAEIVDVATGMVIRRLHAAAADFKAEAWTENLRMEISRAREDWKTSGGQMQAVTLLGVGAIPGMTESDTARSVVSAGLMAEVDASPGCIALTRMQMGPLVEEQTLGQEGSIWQSAWALEAGVGRPTEDKLVLRLRLKNLRSGEQFDADGEGSPKRMGELVGSVWSGLAAKAKISEARPAREGEAAAEGKALLEEAEWRFKQREFDAAARLADSAHYLGHDGPATQRLRIQARISATTVGTNEHVDRNGPERVAAILSRLPDAVEALDLMNEQFDASLQGAFDREDEIMRTGGNSRGDLGVWLGVLARCRGSVPVTGATPAEEAAARRLDEGLQRWCRAAFPKVLGGGEAGRRALPAHAAADVLNGVDPRCLPWLPEQVAGFLADSFREESDPARKARLALEMGNLIELLALQVQVTGSARDCLFRPVPGGDPAKHLLAELDEIDPALLARFEKEAELLAARGESRAKLADEIAGMRVAELRAGKNLSVAMVPDEMLARYRVIENFDAKLLPADEESYCPGALSSVRSDGELLRNLRGYSVWKQELPDKARVVRVLTSQLVVATRDETRPGVSRARSRAAAAAKMANLSEAALAALVKPLPQDLKPEAPVTAAGDGVEVLVSLPTLPAGADDFIIGRVVGQPGKELIWWSGCLVKGIVSPGNSPQECLPALARVTIATGKVDIVTSPSGWGDWKRKRDKMINPKESIVHASANRVVWHLPKVGVFEVDPGTLAMTPLIKQIGKIPTSITSPVNAGAIAGDAFFVAEDDGWLIDRRELHVAGSQRVLCLRPGRDPVVVVETSRRPESTPLDGQKNQLTLVASAGDKVRIFANTEWAYRDLGILMVEFTTAAEPGVTATSKDKAEIDRHIHRTKGEKFPFDPGIGRWSWGDGISAAPGAKSRAISVGKGNESRPVDLTYPAPAEPGGTYDVEELDGKGKPTGKRVRMTSAEYVGSGRGWPAIVGETDDSLLVMQRWGTSGEMPPLLWKVSKKHLENEAGK